MALGKRPGGRSIDEILGSARRRLVRLNPQTAAAALRDGAIIVDIRPQAQQAAEGSVPCRRAIGPASSVLLAAQSKGQAQTEGRWHVDARLASPSPRAAWPC